MLRLALKSYGTVFTRASFLPTSSTISYRFKGILEEERGKDGKADFKSVKTADVHNVSRDVEVDEEPNITLAKKHIHDEYKEMHGDHIHLKTKDVFESEIDRKIPAAHQADYSGKLWEDGGSSTMEEELPEGMGEKDGSTQPLPESWDEMLNDPSVKGEGGDRVFYEAKHLHNRHANMDQVSKK